METDAEVVAETIRGAALCMMCVARKTGLAPLRIIGVLATPENDMKIIEAETSCSGCLQVKATYRI